MQAVRGGATDRLPRCGWLKASAMSCRVRLRGRATAPTPVAANGDDVG
jgi:hypothetical protein